MERNCCFLFHFFTLLFSSSFALSHHCGYDTCDVGRPHFLNVHLIPHSHDDVGWLKTVDQYYYGSRNQIQRAGVQYILDSVIRELARVPTYRFSYVEVSFFYRWWLEQEEATKQLVRQLVNRGQLQFITGGWSMNDEAATHYSGIIDQHTRGMRFLRDHFGDCGRPRVAWQIDPFGHSREQALLFTQMGFDSVFFQRIDYREKLWRKKTQHMEIIWRADPNSFDPNSNLFTSVLYETYCQPQGFCFDVECVDEPIMDDQKLFDYNVQKRVDQFLKYVEQQASAFSTNHILVPMGCDFQYQNAHQNFKNMDKLIEYVNKRQVNGSRVNLLYSTPTCYTYAVNQANQSYTFKHTDFFPYASAPHKFWTGYFTSRPALKGFVRTSNAFLQATQQLVALAGGNNHPFEMDGKLDEMRRALGILLHHDAITGTEKQSVADDYALRLHLANKAGEEIWNELIGSLTVKNMDGKNIASSLSNQWRSCHLANISRCDPLNNATKFQLAVYNPLSWPLSRLVKVPVQCQYNWDLITSVHSTTIVQLVPVNRRILQIPERGSQSHTNCTLLFLTEMDPLQLKLFYLEGTPLSKHQLGPNFFTPSRPINPKTTPILTLENENLLVEFDTERGVSRSVTDKHTNITVPMEQSLKYYLGNSGKNTTGNSGAYIFRPKPHSPLPKSFPYAKIEAHVQGPICQEVHQHFAYWASQITRLCKGDETLEIEWIVGPIPDNNGKQSREVISNFQTNIDSSGEFYTDANARQTVFRQRNGRDYPFNQTEKVAGNYYPITSRIMLLHNRRGHSHVFSVFTDRAQGGSSIRDGQTELMLHRRTSTDDGQGMGEPLKENGTDGRGLVVSGKHHIYFVTIPKFRDNHRRLETNIFLQPVNFVKPTDTLSEDVGVFQYSGLTFNKLPPNLHILTLDKWETGSLLLRLENLNHPLTANWNKVTVDLTNLFSEFDVTNAIELDLVANQKKKDVERLLWRSTHQQLTPHSSQSKYSKVDSLHRNSSNRTYVTLKAGQIGTYRISINRHFTTNSLKYTV